MHVFELDEDMSGTQPHHSRGTGAAETLTAMTNSQPARRVSRRAMITGSVGVLGLAAAGGTAWALDRYLIEHADVTSASDYQGLPGTQTSVTAAPEGTATSAGDGVLDGLSYTSSDRSIAITAHTSGSGNSALAWYVADVQLKDVTALRNAFAKDTFGTNIIEYPTAIATSVGALFAINGDYYGFRDDGIIIRDGVAFRNEPARQGLAIMRDGSMVSYDETATNAAQLIADGAWQTLSFGPTLVDGGQAIQGIDQIEVDTNFGNHSVQGNQPRTGLGMIAPNHFVFVVVDGRSNGYSEGITMPDFAQLFVDLGAQVAYNLDGGGSTQMVFNDALVNNPLGKNKERGTSDILWIGR